MQDIESLSGNVLDRWDFSSCVNLCRFLRSKNCHHLTRLLSTYFLEVLGDNVDLLDELGICLWYLRIYQDSFDVYSRAISIPGIGEERFKHLIFNQHFSAEVICENQDSPSENVELYTTYPVDIVDRISNRSPREIRDCVVSFSVTTCKRMDLFERTINSFLRCALDLHLIGEWYIVDDHSDPKDLDRIRVLYPFFCIISKNRAEKGHPHSMNIIREVVKTPFLFHMEDDWLFYRKYNYIQSCLDVLTSDYTYGQCLINLNYSELPSDNISGGLFKTTLNSMLYYQHDYYPDQDIMPMSLKTASNCAYWPHFSFRPSLIKTRIFREIGTFDPNASHFEMEYAYRYVSKGFVSCFLPHISCKHIGRLTSERHDSSKANAYQLNGEPQFSRREPKDISTIRIKNFVINLDRRSDRWHRFLEKSKELPLDFTRFSGVDGENLHPTRQLYRLFDTNDYDYRKGMVGCALSHLQIIINLVYDNNNDAYFILEDDVDFCDNFYRDYCEVVSELIVQEWGILYLGHTPYPGCSEKSGRPLCKKMSTSESLQRSMGGAFGYLINKRGATQLLEYISEHGMSNAIDTMQQKSADRMGGVHYSIPQLLTSRIAYQSDIQNTFNSLYKTREEIVDMEIDFLREKGVEYTLSEKKQGICWEVCDKWFSIDLSDIGKISDMLYTRRIKKIIRDDVIYTVSDCIS